MTKRIDEYMDNTKVIINEYEEKPAYTEEESKQEGFSILCANDLQAKENENKNENKKSAYYIKSLGRCKNNGNFWLLVENAFNSTDTSIVFFTPEKLYCLMKDSFNVSLIGTTDKNGFPIGKDFLQSTEDLREMLKGNRLLQLGKDYIKIVA